MKARRHAALVTVLGLLGAGLSVPRTARANSGNNNSFLETIGISIAVGTVLGASTLPFYSQPGKHLMNLAYGASAGAVVGVGVMLYLWAEGDGQTDENEGYRSSSDTDLARGPRLAQSYSGRSLPQGRTLASLDQAPVAPAPAPAAQFWMPVVSLSW